MQHFTDRPCAASGLMSFRYRGRFGWVMIGATSVDDALNEALRSVQVPVSREMLQVWTGDAYENVDDV